MIKKILQRRREREYVKRVLAVGAGLDVVETPHIPSISESYAPVWDLLWGAAAVIAPILFALVVIVRMFH
jgi:hypothetical protein